VGYQKYKLRTLERMQMSQCTCIFKEDFPTGDIDNKETSCSNAQKKYFDNRAKACPEERKFP
jgi:hypothetical protein